MRTVRHPRPTGRGGVGFRNARAVRRGGGRAERPGVFARRHATAAGPGPAAGSGRRGCAGDRSRGDVGQRRADDRALAHPRRLELRVAAAALGQPLRDEVLRERRRRFGAGGRPRRRRPARPRRTTRGGRARPPRAGRDPRSASAAARRSRPRRPGAAPSGVRATGLGRGAGCVAPRRSANVPRPSRGAARAAPRARLAGAGGSGARATAAPARGSASRRHASGSSSSSIASTFGRVDRPRSVVEVRRSSSCVERRGDELSVGAHRARARAAAAAARPPARERSGAAGRQLGRHGGGVAAPGTRSRGVSPARGRPPTPGGGNATTGRSGSPVGGFDGRGRATGASATGAFCDPEQHAGQRDHRGQAAGGRRREVHGEPVAGRELRDDVVTEEARRRERQTRSRTRSARSRARAPLRASRCRSRRS